MADSTRWTPFADYVSQNHGRGAGPMPGWAHPTARMPRQLNHPEVRAHLEVVLDTVVAVQKADWLEDGLYIGPKTLTPAWDDLVEVGRHLDTPVPVAVATRMSALDQGALGTDARPIVGLSALYLQLAAPEARRFAIGRAVGQIATRQVTGRTLHALTAGHLDIGRVAGQVLGPALYLLMAPLSVGVQALLARWHRAAELEADRAGMIVVGDLEIAGRSLIRLALGTSADVAPADYLARLQESRDPDAPGKWSELLAERPFLHKRLQALEVFSRGAWWQTHHGGDGGLTDAEVAEAVDALLEVR